MIVTILLLFGFIYLLLDEFTFVKTKVSKSVSSHKFSDKSDIENKLESFISKKIRLPPEKENDLNITLDMLDISKTASEHFAETISKSIIFSLIFILLGLILQQSLVSVLGIVLGIFYYYQTYKKLSKQREQVLVSIEKELPKLCSVISSKLTHTSNVEIILRSYYPISTNVMKRQLDITLADISSSNVSSALTRFSNRIHSPKLSDVTRGLISVSNGNDGRVFFQSKAIEFRNTYKNIIKLEVQKRPSKLFPMQFFIVIFFMSILLYPVFIYIIQTQNSIIN